MIRARIRRPRAVALAAAVALVAAGCSGDDDDAAETGTTQAAPDGTGTAETTEAAASYQWALVTDTTGATGTSTAAYAGDGLQRAAEELGGTLERYEPAAEGDYAAQLTAAAQDGASLVVTVAPLADAVAEAAAANPDVPFVVLDDNGTVADPGLANVQVVQFRLAEGAFLAGIIAGLTTAATTVGFVALEEGPAADAYIAGLEQGIDYANFDDPGAITVTPTYVGATADAAAAGAAATQLYADGADIVVENVGDADTGVYDAAVQAGAGTWVVGTGQCEQELAPDHFLTSVTRDIASAAYYGATQVVDDVFAPGAIELGLTESAVDICQDTLSSLDELVVVDVTDARSALESGDLVVETP
ncbi:MAG: BMP family ABC transporter substrate-binding protein [Actinomycetota bacterium]|nr:BMP family ABC transporter substrate-binding protein [Actinomycetota bacterium]